MNSTSSGITMFATNFLTEKFSEIDQFAFKGCDPRDHKDWKNFLEELKRILTEEPRRYEQMFNEFYKK